MKYFNALLLAGLILCGLAVLIGSLLGNGSIQGLAAFELALLGGSAHDNSRKTK